MDVATRSTWPVYSAAGANEVYLVMIQEGERLKVIPTELGRKMLNGRFWPLWLQTLLLTKSNPKLSYGVSVSGNYMYVSSSGTLQELKYTVASLAAQIRPLEAVLELEPEEGPKSGAVWRVREDGRRLPSALLASELKLPSGASLLLTERDSGYPNFTYKYCELRLYRERSCRTPLRELMRLVEWQFALSCEKP